MADFQAKGAAATATANKLRQRRPSISDSILHTVKVAEQQIEKGILLLWDELPSWRRDNAFIRSGYRPVQGSYLASLRSLFYLHNESVNIWSHLTGAVLVFLTGIYLYGVIHPRYESATASDVLVFACFLGSALLCLSMSAAYHALMDHSRETSAWANKLDYTGIVALIVGSFVPSLYYGFFCRPWLRAGYLYLIFTLGAGCAIVSWVERFRAPQWRTYRTLMFAGLGISGVIPICHGLVFDSYDALHERMGLGWIVLQGIFYIIGAFLYAVRWPERSFPGAFDIWGSSHQIFHMFVLFAAATHFYGMTKAFDHHHTVMGSQC